MNLVARSSAAAAAAAVLVLACSPAAYAASPPAAAPSPQAQAAVGWLTAELGRGGGSMPGFTPGRPDVGLTEDVVLALTAAGQGTSTAARTATTQVAGHVADFVSYDSLGTEFKGVRLAGPLAKSLLVDEVQGGDGHAFGGWDLEGDLRALMVTSGTTTGRFADKNAFAADASNGFSQALSLLALRRTSGGVPSQAIDFLLAQQCPAGGFRLFYDTGSSCASNSGEDTDATSLAIDALLSVGSTPAVQAAASRAVGWLAGLQGSDGSFAGNGPTASPNSNSTGLAGAALLAAGESAAAGRAAADVASLQILSGPDAGAVGYDHAALAAVTGGVIDDLSRDQWRRATAQGVLALGLPGYGQIVAVPAPSGGSGGSGGGPVTGGTSTATLSARSVDAGGSVSLTGNGFRPNEPVKVWLHSTPVLLASSTASAAGAVKVTVRIPASAAGGRHELAIVGSASGHEAVVTFSVRARVAQGASGEPAADASGGSTLPDTGGRTTVPATVSLALLLGGGCLVALARLPARRRPRDAR